MADFIPEDIWIYVFFHVPADERPRLLLVSRAWRNLANATPLLWTHLNVLTNRQWRDHTRLSLWLNKSQNCPLDVHLNLELSYSMWERAVQLLSQHLSRVRVLHISASNTSDVDIILPMIALKSGDLGNPAPLLEEFCLLIGCDVNPIDYPTYFEHAFDPSPLLLRVTHDASRIPPPSSKMLSNVTSFVLSASPRDLPPHVDGILDAISTIPHLHSLKYSGPETYSYQMSDVGYPRVVRLEDLEVASITAPGCGLDILRRIDTPALLSLCLDGWRQADYQDDWDDGGDTPVSATLELLSNRAPRLRSLTMRYLEFMNPNTFVWLLTQSPFPQLSELCIEGMVIPDDAFRFAPADTPLRRLELRYCQGLTGAALVTYVRNRRLRGDNDFEVLVDGCPEVSGEHILKLSQLLKGTSYDGNIQV